MYIIINSLLFISVQSVFVVAQRYEELHFAFNRSNCQAKGLETRNAYKNVSEWMERREDTSLTQCEIKQEEVVCYRKYSSTSDFNEMMNVVYMIPRDKEVASVPTNESLGLGTTTSDALKDYDCILTAMFSWVESRALQTKSKVTLFGTRICGGKSQIAVMNVDVDELKTLSDRGDVAMRVQTWGTQHCVDFFWRGLSSPNRFSEDLTIRAKLMQQLNSGTAQFHCTRSPAHPKRCSVSGIKKLLPEYLKALSVQTREQLREKPVDRTILESRGIWKTEHNPHTHNHKNRSVGSVVFVWLMSLTVVAVLLVTVRSASSYEYIEERKALKLDWFTLKSAEKRLQKRKPGCPGSDTIAVQISLDRIRRGDDVGNGNLRPPEPAAHSTTAPAPPVHTSRSLPLPNDSSDFGSLNKKKNNNKKPPPPVDVSREKEVVVVEKKTSEPRTAVDNVPQQQQQQQQPASRTDQGTFEKPSEATGMERTAAQISTAPVTAIVAERTQPMTPKEEEKAVMETNKARKGSGEAAKNPKKHKKGSKSKSKSNSKSSSHETQPN